MKLRTKIGESYVKYRVRTDRGGTYFSEIEGLLNALQSGGVIILLISTYFHRLPPLWVLPIIWLVKKLCEYIFGTIDEKYLGWWQKQNSYVTANVNPFWASMKETLDRIENKIQK